MFPNHCYGWALYGPGYGAAALLLTSLEEAKKKSIIPLAKIVSWSSVGVDPALMGLGPIKAIQEASKKAKLAQVEQEQTPLC